MKMFRTPRDQFALRRHASRNDWNILGIFVSSLTCLFMSATAVAANDSGSAPTPLAAGQDTAASSTDSANSNPTTQAQNVRHFYIQEYRVEGGGHLLPNVDVEAAVYPYLGPYRTWDDVEQARVALQQAYRDKGFQTVLVQTPVQVPKGGVVVLQVLKGEVARLRVHGSRYFSIDQIKREAPSLQEGQSPNFSQVNHDLLALNQLSDRRVTPTVTAGKTPGTVDVNLDVKDTLPIHGSLEINNRYSADTTPLRINGSVSYDNLWQLEHSIGFSFQLSPEDLSEVKVFSGYYRAPIPAVDGLALMLEGTKQNSDVNTLSGIGSTGNGETIGGRAIFTLPTKNDPNDPDLFYHSVSLGVDYKHLSEDAIFHTSTLPDVLTPVTYYPLSAAYSGTWLGKGYETDFNSSVNLAFRGAGNDEVEASNKRYGASGNFIYFRGDLSHTRDLPGGLQGFLKAQGQVADQPLFDSEEFSGGGLGTVRGYLESEVQGDNAILGAAELRSPSLKSLLGATVDEWRFYLFGEGGILAINEPLPGQDSRTKLASVGVGSRFKLVNHLNGSLDVGLPLDNGPDTFAYETRLTFRLWADF